MSSDSTAHGVEKFEKLIEGYPARVPDPSYVVKDEGVKANISLASSAEVILTDVFGTLQSGTSPTAYSATNMSTHLQPQTIAPAVVHEVSAKSTVLQHFVPFDGGAAFQAADVGSPPTRIPEPVAAGAASAWAGG